MSYSNQIYLLYHLVNITKLEGWKKATLGFLRKTDIELYRQACDESLVDWRFLLPINKDSLVLDYGSGLGITSIMLSQICKTVISVDSCYEYQKFLKLRLNQENIRNVHPVLISNDLNIPFAKNRYDVIVIGRNIIDRHKRKNQKKQLYEEIIKVSSRLLKPGGILFLRVRNKFLKKASDDLLLELGHCQAKKILKNLDYINTNFFFPLPSDGNIQTIVSLKELHLLNYYFTNVKSVRSYPQKVKYLIVQILIKLKSFKYFSPYFYVVATKS